jgi:hypothetical protein
MITVENFYWVLYEHFLKPLSLNEYSFYPFGKTDFDNLVINLHDPGKNQTDAQIRPSGRVDKIIFFDQEPLGSAAIKILDIAAPLCRFGPYVKILANSEISSLKDFILPKYNMIDWYYFYHGFAALDWFNDAKYLSNVDYPIHNHFLSLNGIVTGDRQYRIALTACLAEKQILNKGSVSFHAAPGECMRELNESSFEFSDDIKQIIKNQLQVLDNGIYIDTTSHDPKNSASFGHKDLKMFQQSFFHIVNETIFHVKKLHLTEKVFKPIISKRPFVLVAAPGNLEYLKRYGFKTFDKWVDEDYDLEADNEKRLIMIANEIEKISKLSLPELNQMHAEMKSVLEYNFNHFFGNFKTIIVNELVDNFQQIVLQWNQKTKEVRPELPELNWTALKKMLIS